MQAEYAKWSIPLVFKSIDIFVKVNSLDAMQRDIDKALMLAEQNICPVTAMIRGNVEIKLSSVLL